MPDDADRPASQGKASLNHLTETLSLDTAVTRVPRSRLTPPNGARAVRQANRRKEVMSPYQFKISQSVRFRYHERMRSAAPGNYKIVGYQPNDGEEPRYRIKSDLEQYERIARESELSQVG
jgi:hypothetical protein